MSKLLFFFLAHLPSTVTQMQTINSVQNDTGHHHEWATVHKQGAMPVTAQHAQLIAATGISPPTSGSMPLEVDECIHLFFWHHHMHPVYHHCLSQWLDWCLSVKWSPKTHTGCDTVVTGHIMQVVVDGRDISVQSQSVLSETVVDVWWSSTPGVAQTSFHYTYLFHSHSFSIAVSMTGILFPSTHSISKLIFFFLQSLLKSLAANPASVCAVFLTVIAIGWHNCLLTYGQCATPTSVYFLQNAIATFWCVGPMVGPITPKFKLGETFVQCN